MAAKAGPSMQDSRGVAFRVSPLAPAFDLLQLATTICSYVSGPIDTLDIFIQPRSAANCDSCSTYSSNMNLVGLSVESYQPNSNFGTFLFDWVLTKTSIACISTSALADPKRRHPFFQCFDICGTQLARR